MLTYYCIPSCDKCRAARKLLNENNIAHQEIDMRKDGVSEAQLSAWIDAYGLDTILNKRSTTYKQLGERQSALPGAAIAIIQENPAILHRPILDFGDHLLLSKDALSWLEAPSR